MFATAFYGVIDLSAGTFTYSCAGHPGPIIDGPGRRPPDRRGPRAERARASA